ncbi:endonuclease/exonuclease/phosphatase family protein [Paenibacillus agaridevorans]|uniref:endonuclease/exonuclease/phosphatase family protein n=1 Tax=Paenibacillus agaridevorans TaxID=171404 RepID=UPI001BE3E4DF|nr:endonuclease/exonuclease/phosphatase family protein [Paenibacillus agaridevorans]
MKLTVMTFNLRVNVSFDGDNAWPNRKQQVADTILSYNPAIIGTQEGRYDMLEDLDGLLPAYTRIGEGRAGYRSGDESLDECCAIYYDKRQLALLEEGQFWLSETPGLPSGKAWDADYPRFCTWARLESVHHSGNQLYLFNTHFDHIGEMARARSAQLILDKIVDIIQPSEAPCILTGDLNCHPNDAAIRLLAEQLTDAYGAITEPLGRTFHAFEGGTPGEPIDYIFTSPNVTVEETSIIRSKINGRYPSDHYPVVAKLSF